jgi:hypothetical protein
VLGLVSNATGLILDGTLKVARRYVFAVLGLFGSLDSLDANLGLIVLFSQTYQLGVIIETLILFEIFLRAEYWVIAPFRLLDNLIIELDQASELFQRR